MNKFRLLFIFLILLLGSVFVSKSTLAFQTPDDSYPLLYQQAITSQDMNLQSFVRETIKAIMFSFADQAGFPKLSTVGGGTPGPVSNNDGLVQTLAYLIGSIYQTKPASGVQYVADAASRLGIVKPAIAAYQGGFNSMKVLIPIWSSFRNMTYLLFVLIFVITGFAIMFRFKVDPRTIITLEAALPKIIVGLVLVTFSYAIAGFLIDIMWVLCNLIISLFTRIPHGPPTSITQLMPVYENMGATQAIIIAGTVPFLVGATMMAAIGLAGGSLVGNVIGPLAGPIGLVIFLVIFVVVFIIALLRILWSLLRAYVNVVLAIVFAPFQITIGTLPGNSGINGWLTNIITNLAVLPIVMLMVLLAGYLTNATVAQVPGLGPILNGILPNTFTSTSFPTLGEKLSSPVYAAAPNSTFLQQLINFLTTNTTPDAIGMLLIMVFVSLGLMLMAPKVADMIKNAMAGKPIGDRIGIGESFGPAVAAGRLGAAGGIEAGYNRFTTSGPQGANPIPANWQGLAKEIKEAAVKKIVSGR